MNGTRYACGWDWANAKYVVVPLVGQQVGNVFVVDSSDEHYQTACRVFSIGKYGAHQGVPMERVAKSRKGAAGKQLRTLRKTLKDALDEVAAAQNDVAAVEAIYGALL